MGSGDSWRLVASGMARDFHTTLETEFANAFSDIVFAITDRSPGQRTSQSVWCIRDLIRSDRLKPVMNVMDWFEKLTGFRELGFEQTRDNLEVVGDRLRSKVNNRSFRIGYLETPSLAELRARAAEVVSRFPGRLSVKPLSGDVRAIHADAASADALFQVASQFNLLEMIGPDVTPEQGVTRYEYDPTQGPACAIAAGAATIYRNYLAPIGNQSGQTSFRQFDCLRDVGAALGNKDGSLWRMQNGYALCTADGLARIARLLDTLPSREVDALRDKLRIGLHWDIELTDAPTSGRCVSQAFCSALPVSYTDVPQSKWRSFATLVLEGAYEATLWAAVLNAGERGSRKVFLTRVGGGAFGNDRSWIDSAMWRALDKVRDLALEVFIVSRKPSDSDLSTVGGAH